MADRNSQVEEQVKCVWKKMEDSRKDNITGRLCAY